MSLPRTCIERLSRGRTFWRRLPAPFGAARILVTPDAALSNLKWGRDWCDGELLKMAGEFVKPGDTAWDVGANLGVFGVAAAVRGGSGGSVLCVEPDLMLAQLIRRTAMKLPPQCAALRTLSVAVADRPGIAEFLISQRGRASNALAAIPDRSQMGGIRERQLVPVLTLDDLLQISPSPAFVKIDVEGAEALVFDGAKRLLSEIRPIIYVEVIDENSARVTAQLQAAGYDLFDPRIPLTAQTPRSTCAFNTLAMPR